MLTERIFEDHDKNISHFYFAEVTRRNCRPCGPNVIPYPLSSEPHCGDSSYYSFACNDSTGEVSFQTLNGSYPVIDIDIDNRTFVIQVHEENSCDNTKKPGTQVAWLNQSLPFHPINRCYNTEKLQNRTSGQARYGIRMIMWEPPLEPTCITSADCEDWPNSSCNMIGQGKRRCLCNQYYKWDGLVLNCTTGVDHLFDQPPFTTCNSLVYILHFNHQLKFQFLFLQCMQL